jgi:CubicO group peptidase (beta-lactamase class C family)
MAGFVTQVAAKYGVPGVAVGIWTKGREYLVCHGVTDVGQPAPIEPDTPFVVASVTKTFTATAMMRLIADGQVELHAPVRRYLPDFAVADASAAAQITVLNLLNHTAGLGWRAPDQPDNSDDALARYVTALRGHRLIAPPATRVSYSQTGYNVAGRIIEVVTGMTYEQAIATLLLEPLKLRHSTFAPREAIIGPVSMGHNVAADGTITVAQQWKDTRANNPGGGLAASVSDLLTWAHFHLMGDGGQVLPEKELRQMRHPTAKLVGSSLGDAIGIGWFLRDIGNVHAFGHAGSANGQFTEVLIVPDKDFAVVTVANSGPDSGLAFNSEIVQAGLESVAGVTGRKVKVVRYRRRLADEYAGVYENEMMRAVFTNTGKALTAEFAIKPDVRANAAAELPPDMPAAPIAFLRGEHDHYMVTDGGLKGQRGYFSRDASGRITTVDMAGRVFTRALRLATGMFGPERRQAAGSADLIMLPVGLVQRLLHVPELVALYRIRPGLMEGPHQFQAGIFITRREAVLTAIASATTRCTRTR